MIILHGVYHVARTRLAYRNDYCVTCAAPRMALCERTLDLLHVFWIPVLPLGLWKRWHCSRCGSDPHARVTTRPLMKWLGIGCLVLISATFWLVPGGEVSREDVAFLWGMRLGAPIVTVVALWATVRGRREASLAELLRGVEPNHDTSCPFCGCDLIPDQPNWRCPRCAVERAVLPAA